MLTWVGHESTSTSKARWDFLFMMNTYGNYCRKHTPSYSVDWRRPQFPKPKNYTCRWETCSWTSTEDIQTTSTAIGKISNHVRILSPPVIPIGRLGAYIEMYPENCCSISMTVAFMDFNLVFTSRLLISFCIRWRKRDLQDQCCGYVRLSVFYKDRWASS